MRVGDRFDLPQESIHGVVVWIMSGELSGDLMGFCVHMDDGRFASIDPRKLPAASETLQ